MRLAYERVPSFRREEGGTYTAYVAVYSRCYRLFMRWRHRGGMCRAQLEEPVSPDGINIISGGRIRCSWCGRGWRP